MATQQVKINHMNSINLKNQGNPKKRTIVQEALFYFRIGLRDAGNIIINLPYDFIGKKPDKIVS